MPLLASFAQARNSNVRVESELALQTRATPFLPLTPHAMSSLVIPAMGNVACDGLLLMRTHVASPLTFHVSTGCIQGGPRYIYLIEAVNVEVGEHGVSVYGIRSDQGSGKGLRLGELHGEDGNGGFVDVRIVRNWTAFLFVMY